MRPVRPVGSNRETRWKAIVYERHGGPDVLSFEDVPDPRPADGQVLVDVQAVGVNFRDVYEREGREYVRTPPPIVGIEGAGTVARTGRRVGWTGVPNTYAQPGPAEPQARV